MAAILQPYKSGIMMDRYGSRKRKLNGSMEEERTMDPPKWIKKEKEDPDDKKKPTCGATSLDRTTPIANIRASHDGEIVEKVKGKVVFCSKLEKWNKLERCGLRIYFDISDISGTIRVIAWDDAAVFASKIIHLGISVQLQNVIISSRKKLYNNTDHPYELKIPEPPQVSNLTKLVHKIEPEERKYVSVNLNNIKDQPPCSYFSISGKITEVSESISGQGPEGNDYTGKFIKIEDKQENTAKISVFNEYIPVTDELVGKLIILQNCKYSSKYNSVCMTGSYVYLDGLRVI